MADNDAVWLDVLPSMRGFGSELVKGATKAAKDAGEKSGKDYASAFEDGAGGASSAAIKELETAEAQASGLVKKLSGEVSKARQAQQRATAGVLTAEQAHVTALQRQEQAARDVAKATDALQTAIDAHGDGSAEAAKAQEDLADATSKQTAESKKAEAAALKLQAAQGKAADDAARFENAENGLREAHKSAERATEQLTEAQRDLGNEVEEAPKKWGRVTDALGTAGGKMQEFGESAGGIATQIGGAVGAAALFGEAWSGAVEQESSVDRLNAALAATPEQAATYGEAASSLYASGWGESMEEVAGSVDAVVSSMSGMRDASQADIEKITTYALNMADAFGVDVTEAATTAGSMMTNGLAGDAVHAMDLITGAMNQVPAGLRGEVLPVMDEYGKSFGQLGIDGETAVGMIVAASGDGAIGMDKMGDSLKEFTIRATDMSKSTSGVYETLGLDMEDMTNKLLAGGDTAEGAMAQIVHGLQGIKDPGEQAAAAIALFGTPLEDLGTDEIPNFLGMVDPMGDAFQNLDESAHILSDTLNDNTATSLITMQRGFQDMLMTGIEPLLGPLQGFFTWATETPGVLEAVGIALGVVAGAIGLMTLAASPWLLWGVAIAAVVGGIVLAVQNWGTITEWATEVWGGFLNWMREVWDGFLVWMGEVLGGFANWWNELWGGIGSFFEDTWNGALNWVREKAYEWFTWWFERGAEFGEWWNGLWGSVGSFFEDTWNGALNWVQEKAFQWFTWWFDRGAEFGDWWDGLWTGVGDTATSLFDGLVSGVKSIWENNFRPIFDIIGQVLRGDFVGAFESAKEHVGRVWRGIGNVVRDPINFVIETVYNDGLKKVFDKVAGVVGISPLPDAQPLPAFADGGLHRGGWALVGEEGPELVNFDQPGRVYTAAETQAMLDGRDQAPADALTALTGASPSQSAVPAGNFWDDPWGNALSVGKSVWDNTIGAGLNWARGKLADAAVTVTDPLKDLLRDNLGGTWFGDATSGAVSTLIDGAIKWLRGKDEEAQSAGVGIIYDGPRGPFHRPSAGPFTSMYGPRWGGHHAGVDIAGGGPTVAAQSGIVQDVGWNIGPGRTGIGVLLNHGPGFYTYYGHNPSMGAIPVRPGDEVQGGDRIGAQGATGNVTGVHLHFETHDGGPWADVNPMQYLKYDNGGVLAPGVTPALNATGRPEVVFTEPQWQILERMVDDAERHANGRDGHSFNYHAGTGGGSPREFFDEASREIRRMERGGVR